MDERGSGPGFGETGSPLWKCFSVSVNATVVGKKWKNNSKVLLLVTIVGDFNKLAQTQKYLIVSSSFRTSTIYLSDDDGHSPTPGIFFKGRISNGPCEQWRLQVPRQKHNKEASLSFVLSRFWEMALRPRLLCGNCHSVWELLYGTYMARIMYCMSASPLRGIVWRSRSSGNRVNGKRRALMKKWRNGK